MASQAQKTSRIRKLQSRLIEFYDEEGHDIDEDSPLTEEEREELARLIRETEYGDQVPLDDDDEIESRLPVLPGAPLPLPPAINAFCPTGKGGGVNPTCSPGKSGGSGDVVARAAKMVADHEADPHNRQFSTARESWATEHSRLVGEAGKAATYTESKALLQKAAEAKAKVDQIDEAMGHEARRSMILAFGVSSASEGRVSTNDIDTYDKRHREAATEKAMEYIARVATREGVAGVDSVTVRYAKGGRASYQYGSLYMEKGTKPEIVSHEYGHHLETRPGVLAKVQEFARKRFGDERPVDMADVDPKAGYKRGEEQGRKDDFEKLHGTDNEGRGRAYYTGKTYPDGSTEILSMGLEQLYRDPVKFAKQDPEYFALVVGILQEGK